jgi:hypothetical protein
VEIVSGAKATASANVLDWKFRVGSVPSRLKVSRLLTVPSSRYFSVAGPNDRCESCLLYRISSSGRANSTCLSPRTAMAFKFFEPITAPLPPRPAWRPSCDTVANRTRFSPAGPMAAIRNPAPNVLPRIALASRADFPHAADASSNRTPSGSITTHTGDSAAPTITKASYPVFFPAIAKCDDDSESLIRQVSGDWHMTANFADVVNGLPTSGLNTNASGASGAKGSCRSRHSRSRSHVPSPLPPKKFRSTSGGNSTASALRRARSICR